MPTRFRSNKAVKAALASAKNEAFDSVSNGYEETKTTVKRGIAGTRDSVLQKFGIVNLRTAPKISYAIRGAVCAVESKRFITYHKDYKKFVKICNEIDNKLKKDEQKASQPGANLDESLLPSVAQIDTKISDIGEQIRELEETESSGGKLKLLQNLKSITKYRSLNELVEELKKIKTPKRGASKSPKQKALEDEWNKIRDKKGLEDELKTFERMKKADTDQDKLKDLKEDLEALKKLKRGGAARSKKLVDDFRSAVKSLSTLSSSFAEQKSKIKKYQAKLDAKRAEISKLTDKGKAERIQKFLVDLSKIFYLFRKKIFFREYGKVADATFDSIIELRKVTDRDKITLLKPREKFQLISIQQQLFAIGDVKKEYSELEDFVKKEIRALNDKTWKIFRKKEGNP